MVGPKLDARTYTTLILTVIALLLGMNLVKAQYAGSDQSARTEASASADLAAATREVAKENGRIADALEKCAEAIGKVKLKVEIPPAASAAPTPVESTPTDTGAPTESKDPGVVFDMK